MDYAAIQRTLASKGYQVGDIDGVPGRLFIAAVKAFQTDHPPLEVDGQVGPKTLAALDLASPASPVAIEPPWIAIGRGKIGMQEIRDNKALRAWLASDGHGLGDPAVLPWCGDYVETCVALALPLEPIRPTTHNNPYWAANWADFGIGLAEPSPGAVLVFTRNGGGHVAFYLGEDGANFVVLGGNQSNSVSVMKIAKNRLAAHGMRWPATFPRPTAGPRKLSVAAALSTNER